MAVHADLISDSGLTKRNDAIEKTRVYHVKGLGGTVAERETLALNAVGIPSLGDTLGNSAPHSLMRVVSLDVTMLDGNQANIKALYSTRNMVIFPDNPSLPKYSGGVAIRDVQTNVNRNGDFVTVTHDGIEYGAFVTRSVEIATITATRIEPLVNPGDVADALSGKVNQNTWNGRGAGWWKCTGVEFDAMQGGLTYEMTYQFERAPDAADLLGKNESGAVVTKDIPWNPVAVYTDPETGEPPAGLVAGVDVVEVDMHDSVDFSDYSL